MHQVRTLFLFLLFAFFACGPSGRQHGDPQGPEEFVIEIRLEWSHGPYVGVNKQHPNRVRLTFTDKEGEPLPIDHLVVYPYMSVHGHAGYPEKYSKIERVEDHIYDVTDFYFIMRGEWEIEVEGKTTQGINFKDSIGLYVQ